MNIEHDDPLVMALAGYSSVSRPSHQDSNYRISRSPPDGAAVDEAHRSVKPKTDAQKRYEKRFLKTHSENRNIEPIDRELSPTPPYPMEILNDCTGYSLEMITPALHSEKWTSPRLDEGLQEPTSVHNNDTNVRQTSETMNHDLDLEIDSQLLELHHEKELSDEDNVERIVEGAGFMRLSDGVNCSLTQHVVGLNVGV
jgi:hypothetical protein